MSQVKAMVAVFRQNRLALGGGLLFLCLIGVALITPWLPLANPDATVLDQGLRAPFSSGSWLGTDLLGRDILSRLFWGLRTSLSMGVLATLIAAIAGSFLGLVTGFFGGWLDRILMRLIDAVMAFPYLLLALLIVAVLGPGLFNALLAVAVVNIPFFARTVRGSVLGLVHRPFVDAARLSGLSEWEIALTELLPNVMPLIVVTTASTVGWMILETAGLSFLGLGVQPPQADLGSMLGEGRSVFIVAPHVATLPGLAIVGMVLSINFLGDGIRDALDPRLQGGQLVRPQAKTAIAPNVLNQDGMGSHASSSSPLNSPLMGDFESPLPLTTQHDTQQKEIAIENEDARSGLDQHELSLIEVQNLSVSFQQQKERWLAVQNVGFSIVPGECLGLVGESGSGKSVTSLALTALVPTPPGTIESGRVEFQQQSVLDQPLSSLRQIRGKRIAYVFQNPMASLNPLLSVGEQMIETVMAHRSLPHRKARAIATELLMQVELPATPKDLNRLPHQLSGGQQQRVAIAMALANQPDLLIADEPTTALDVVTQAKLVGLLKRLITDRRLSLLLISHDLSLVAQLCDRLTVLYAGEVVEMGETQRIIANPSHPYTRLLLNCIPVLGDPLRPLTAIFGEPPQGPNKPLGCAFAPRCPHAQVTCQQQAINLDSMAAGRLVRCLYPQGLNPTHDTDAATTDS